MWLILMMLRVLEFLQLPISNCCKAVIIYILCVSHRGQAALRFPKYATLVSERVEH